MTRQVEDCDFWFLIEWFGSDESLSLKINPGFIGIVIHQMALGLLAREFFGHGWNLGAIVFFNFLFIFFLWRITSPPTLNIYK